MVSPAAISVTSVWRSVPENVVLKVPLTGSVSAGFPSMMSPVNANETSTPVAGCPAGPSLVRLNGEFARGGVQVWPAIPVPGAPAQPAVLKLPGNNSVSSMDHVDAVGLLKVMKFA